MRIALVGTHNSGKTTLFNMMKSDSMFKTYDFEGEKIRDLYNLGFGINEGAGDDSQLALAFLNTTTLFNYRLHSDVVFDRCLLDNYIYAKYLSKKGIVSERVVDLIGSYLPRHLDEFSVIFICSPEFSFEDDGVRDTNKEFQEEIHNLFLEYINGLDSYYKRRFRVLKGKSEDRLKEIKDFIGFEEMGY